MARPSSPRRAARRLRALALLVALVAGVAEARRRAIARNRVDFAQRYGAGRSW